MQNVRNIITPSEFGWFLSKILFFVKSNHRWKFQFKIVNLVTTTFQFYREIRHSDSNRFGIMRLTFSEPWSTNSVLEEHEYSRTG